MDDPLVSSEYLSGVIRQLKSDDFRVTENIMFKNHLFRYVAKRTRFEMEKGGFASTYFIFAEYESLDKELFRSFSKTCVAYSIKKCRIPLPRGFFKSVFCYSVALVPNVDPLMAKAIQTEEPPKHWATGEMPVICDLSKAQLYYFEKTPYWGELMWERMRGVISVVLAPERYDSRRSRVD